MSDRLQSVWRVLALGLATACSGGSVQNGYPPLVTACARDADCAPAGPIYVCVEGGCTVTTCACDDQCAPGLACVLEGSSVGECLIQPRRLPCDAGSPALDGGPDGGTDGGAFRDGGVGDGGAADGGRDGGPDAG